MRTGRETTTPLLHTLGVGNRVSFSYFSVFWRKMERTKPMKTNAFKAPTDSGPFLDLGRSAQAVPAPFLSINQCVRTTPVLWGKNRLHLNCTTQVRS